MVATVAARNLGFWLHKSAILPQLPYNYEELHLNDIKTRQLDPIFDLAETHRHVWLTFARGFPPPADTVADVVVRCCELIQKIIEGEFVNKRMYLEFRGETSRPAALDRFLEEKGSETVVLAEGVQFHLIPLSLTSFIVVDWYKFKSVDTDSNYVFHFNVIESREMFNEHVNELYSKFGVRGIRLKDCNVLNLPVVQNICDRFFA